MNLGATSYLCKVNVIEALARDHESWPCGESRNARFEPSPCRSGFRLRLARRQVAASALRAFAARQDTNTPLRGCTNIGQFFCYNCRPMNKGLIYPDECYAIRGAIYEVHNEMGSGFKEATGFVIPFVKIRVPRRRFS